MTKAKPKIKYRTKIVYRNRPQDEVTTATASVITTSKVNSWIGGITIADMKAWLQVMVPLAVFWWAYLGPYVESKAEEFLIIKLAQNGVDPKNIQSLNEGIAKLNEQAETKDQAVKDLDRKVNELQIGIEKILMLQQQQLAPIVKEPVK